MSHHRSIPDLVERVRAEQERSPAADVPTTWVYSLERAIALAVRLLDQGSSGLARQVLFDELLMQRAIRDLRARCGFDAPPVAWATVERYDTNMSYIALATEHDNPSIVTFCANYLYWPSIDRLEWLGDGVWSVEERERQMFAAVGGRLGEPGANRES